MNLYAFVPTAAFLVNLFVWIYVFAQQSRDPINRTFLLFAACALGWISGELILYLPAAQEYEWLIFRAITVFWVTCGFWYLLFAYAIVERRSDWVLITAGVTSVLPLLLILFTDGFFLGAKHHYWGTAQILHPVYQPLVASVSGAWSGYGLLLILRKRMRSAESLERGALGLLLYGGIVAVSSVAVMNVILPRLYPEPAFPQFGSSALTVFIVFVFVAVTRYKFLSISIEKVAKEIFEDLNDGILLADRNGRVQRSNRTARSMFGEDLDGRTVKDIFAGHDIDGDFADRLIPPGEGPTIRYLSLSASTMSMSGEVIGRIFIVRNVTAQKHAEEVMRRSNEDLERKVAERTEQLRHAERMEAIGTLAGGIAHDFNNVLAAILGFANTARFELPKGSPARQDIEEIIVAGTRGREIVRQILTVGRKQDAAEYRPEDLGTLLRETVDLLKVSLPRNVSLRVHIPEEPIGVNCDVTQLSQVIMNLCNNAVYAMKRTVDGELDVGIERMTIDEKIVARFTQLTLGPGVRFYVRDNGTGIKASDLVQIFNPFFTTKPRGEGTGLGLSSTFVIVHNHKGDIHVESGMGEGTTFSIYLPVVEEFGVDRDNPLRISEVCLPAATGRERIMLVDDEPQVRKMGKRLLEQLGYRVSMFESGEAALQTLRQSYCCCDLIITDYSMPQMTGVELAAAIAAERIKVPIILMSGYGDEVTRDEINANGIAAFLQKPASKHQLSATIRRILDDISPP